MLKITLKKPSITLLMLTGIQLIAFCGIAFSQKATYDSDKNVTKVILMIGDGMGIAQIHAAAANNRLHMLQLPYTALVTTSSANNDITDSGSGGTAIATGTKTDNSKIGINPSNENLKSILKIAEEHGLSTGLVATSDITHATPAAFVANVAHRSRENEIASQFIKSGIDVFIGGGMDNFNKRADNINYTDSLLSYEYYIATSVDELKSHSTGKLAGLLYPHHPPKISEGRGDMLSISTEKALEVLSVNDNGFFLMVEGSQIDWGGHDNNISYIIDELVDFDKAVGFVLEYAQENPGTLVIVTSDHETGGLSLIEDEQNPGKMKPHFSTTHHTASPVPLFAFGQKAELFNGVIDNTDIFHLIMSAYGFNDSFLNKRIKQP